MYCYMAQVRYKIPFNGFPEEWPNNQILWCPQMAKDSGPTMDWIEAIASQLGYSLE